MMKAQDEIIIDIGILPDDLKSVPQWVVWKSQARNDKQTKVPFSALSSEPASSTDSRTWCDFETVCRVFEEGNFDGIGFVFTKDDSFCGIDLDHCRNSETGTITPRAQGVVDCLNSYSEISPSGQGLHIIVKASLPPGRRRRDGLEMYDQGRYFTMTGNHLDGTPLCIESRQQEIADIHGAILASDEIAENHRNTANSTFSDTDLLDRAPSGQNGEKFERLWSGDTTGYASPSEADLALCSILAFWTGGNAERVDRLFRRSALFRKKWDEKHFGDGRTYGQATVAKALEGASEAGMNGDTTLTAAEDRPWPQLDEAALYGLPGEIVRTIEPHTEADRVALLGQVLSEFSCVIGPSSQVVLDGASNPLLFNMVLVGQTSKARKGTADKRIKRVFQLAIYGWTRGECRGNLSSGEGLVDAVRDARDGDPGVEDKRLFLVQSEFGNMLKIMAREGNSLSGVIRDAFDGEDLAPMTKHNKIKSTQPHIVIAGHVTEEELKKHLTSTEACNGFGNRFGWLLVRRSKCLPFSSDPEKHDLSPLFRRLQEAVEFATRPRTLRMSDKAKLSWSAVYPTLSEGRPGMVGALLGRAEAQVMRLAALYALLDKSKDIKKIHLEAALAFWEYVEDSVVYIFGDVMGEWMADKILDGIGKCGQLTDSEISALFKRNISAKRLDEAKRLLQKRKLIESKMVDSNGRPRRVWTLKT